MCANGHATGVLGLNLHLAQCCPKQKQGVRILLFCQRICNHKRVVMNQESEVWSQGLVLEVWVAAVPLILVEQADDDVEPEWEGGRMSTSKM